MGEQSRESEGDGGDASGSRCRPLPKGRSRRRTGRWFGSPAIGVAAVAVALLMVSPPVGAAGASLPRFQGTVRIGYGTGVSSCSNASVLVPPNFSLKTGNGGLGAIEARTGLCPPGPGYGGARAGTSLVLDLNVSLPNGFHSVHPELTIAWTAQAQISKGRGCAPPSPFNSSYNYTSGHGNSTDSYWYNETGALTSCGVRAHVYASVYPLLIDVTNESYFWPNSTCLYGPLGCRVFHLDAVNDSTIGWESWNESRYYRGVWNRTNGSYSFNQTRDTPGSGDRESGVFDLGLYFNDSFVRSHHYVLDLYFVLRANVYLYGWVDGRGSAWANLATDGHGVLLPRIVIT